MKKKTRRKKEPMLKRFMHLGATLLVGTVELAEGITHTFLDPYDYYGYGQDERIKANNLSYKLQSKGYIEKVARDDGSFAFRLTQDGLNKIVEEVPFLRFFRYPWDGKWRVVMFDIKEKKRYHRDFIRKFLLDLGFGMLQKSIYITPFPVIEELDKFLTERNYEQDVLIFEMKNVLTKSQRSLVSKTWYIDQLEEQYQKFIEKWSHLTREPDEIALEDFKNWRNHFFQILQDDPGLYPELLPEDWSGEDARSLFQKLMEKSRRSKRKKR